MTKLAVNGRPGEGWKVNCCPEGFSAGQAAASGYVREHAMAQPTRVRRIEVEGQRVNGPGMDIQKDGEAQIRKFHRSIRRNPVETAALVVLIVALFGGLIIMLRPSPESTHDFFQDHSSARNLLSGRPIYSPMDQAFYEYTGHRLARWGHYNAHPPTSVLLALPFGRMSYVPAAVAWNLLSLVLLAGSLSVLFSELRFNPSLSQLVL